MHELHLLLTTFDLSINSQYQFKTQQYFISTFYIALCLLKECKIQYFLQFDGYIN